MRILQQRRSSLLRVRGGGAEGADGAEGAEGAEGAKEEDDGEAEQVVFKGVRGKAESGLWESGTVDDERAEDDDDVSDLFQFAFEEGGAELAYA